MSFYHRRILLTIALAFAVVVPSLTANASEPTEDGGEELRLHASEAGGPDDAGIVVAQATLQWDLDELLHSYEDTRSFRLPVPSGLLAAAINEVQVWDAHDAVVLEEDASGNWIKVDDITARMFDGVLLDDPLSVIGIAIDPPNSAVAGSAKTQQLLYSFDSEGPDPSDFTKTLVQVTVYYDGDGYGSLSVAPNANPSEADLQYVLQAAADFSENYAGIANPPEDEEDIQPLNHINDLPRHEPGIVVPPIPESIPLQHTVPGTGCANPSNSDAAYCLQVMPYLDTAGEPHDAYCRIAHAFYYMHKLWDSELNIHLEPQAIRKTGTTWSTNAQTHATSFANYLSASSSRMPAGVDIAVVFTGANLFAGTTNIYGAGNTANSQLGTTDSIAMVEIARIDGVYDPGVHIDQLAAHEMMHVAGHGAFDGPGIDSTGHVKGERECVDRSWYGNCKRFERNTMYPTFTREVGMWIYAGSEQAIKGFSHRSL